MKYFTNYKPQKIKWREFLNNELEKKNIKIVVEILMFIYLSPAIFGLRCNHSEILDCNQHILVHPKNN